MRRRTRAWLGCFETLAAPDGTLYYCVADRVTAINPSGSGLDAHAGAKVHRT
jgi:hypothetical protein